MTDSGGSAGNQGESVNPFVKYKIETPAKTVFVHPKSYRVWSFHDFATPSILP